MRQNVAEWSNAASHSLTQGRQADRQPVYSPDGRWILFTSDRSGNLDLWMVSTTTGELRQITDDAADDWDPAFGPDGHLYWSSTAQRPLRSLDGGERRQRRPSAHARRRGRREPIGVAGRKVDRVRVRPDRTRPESGGRDLTARRRRCWRAAFRHPADLTRRAVRALHGVLEHPRLDRCASGAAGGWRACRFRARRRDHPPHDSQRRPRFLDAGRPRDCVSRAGRKGRERDIRAGFRAGPEHRRDPAAAYGVRLDTSTRKRSRSHRMERESPSRAGRWCRAWCCSSSQASARAIKPPRTWGRASALPIARAGLQPRRFAALKGCPSHQCVV